MSNTIADLVMPAPSPSPSSTFLQFLDLSVELTGFAEFTLRGTGYADQYFATALKVVGKKTLHELVTAYTELVQLAGNDATKRDSLLRARVLSDERFGPIARNIIKMWYVSIWFKLPEAWQASFGPAPNDGTFVVSTYAYTEGLLGPAVGAHVQGAKAPGYGTWAEKPEVPWYMG